MEKSASPGDIRIASHHAADPWRPSRPWPRDTYVQWGSSGLVVSRKQSYTTAFFEAFPPREAGADFIRGEGADIDAAEEDAFAQYLKASACKHVWGRRKYTNGYGICVRCGHGRSGVFQPVVRLGAWRDPLSSSDIYFLSSGILDGDPDADEKHYYRSLRLRAALAGLRLPSRQTISRTNGKDEEQAWMERCELVIAEWWKDYRAIVDSAPTHKKHPLSMVHDSISRKYLDGLVEKHRNREGATG